VLEDVVAGMVMADDEEPAVGDAVLFGAALTCAVLATALSEPPPVAAVQAAKAVIDSRAAPATDSVFIQRLLFIAHPCVP
jgi:hypothetical protein